MPSPVIVWFRRDLRLHDHPALAAAIESGHPVVPVFALDKALLSGRAASPNRIAFMLESLESLDAGLRARGSRLHVVRGRPADDVPAFAKQMRATAVYASRDYAPYGRRRDDAVGASLAADGIDWHEAPGVLVQEPEAIATNSGSPYTVFTPFRTRWLALPRRAALSAPARIETPPDAPSQLLPTLTDLGVTPTASMLPAGEAAARERLRAFAAGAIDAYASTRNLIAEDGTSRLSQDLRWGLLSPVEVLEAAQGDGSGRGAFASEVCWRDFYAHILWHFPNAARRAFRAAYKSVACRDAPGELDAWERGATGYPIVDAAMRQLLTTGWMHNRARMIVASFLTKDLLIDWRRGEAHFMRHLVDGDIASNNGGWQWAASTGTDAQPWFRIFNPVLQGQKFDASGDYVRRWVPELAAVPDRYIHAPWTMPLDVMANCAVRIGSDYPAPIVDHAEARARALAAYGQANPR